jgi:uncharacterized tellurite resistance protein B-like protein
MNLTDLTKDERIALVALIKQLVGADAGKTPEEMAEFRAIAEELGRKEFDAAFRAAMSKAGTRAKALELAKTVTRQDARELCHTVLFDLAAADSVSDEERDFIREVAKSWGVHTRL